MKFLRSIAYMTASVILVVSVAFTCLVIFFDPNKLKPAIIREVLKKTGYQLAIEGELSWTLYPRLGVKVPHMTLRQPNQTIPFADLHDVNMATGFVQLFFSKQPVQGVLRIKSLRLMNINAQKAYVGLKWEGETLTLQPITAALYNGTLDGMAHAKNISRTPEWDWNVKMRKVQLKPLLHDVNDSKSKLNVSGDGDVTFVASATGMSKEQILNQLNGVAEFNVNNGIVDGLDLSYLVQTANDLINAHAITLPTHIKQTHFQHLTGTAVIKSGVANINNLLLTSDAFTAKGRGEIYLLQERLHYQLQVTPLNQDKIRWDIPVLITGNLRDPSIRVDTGGLQALLLKDKVQEVKKNVANEIKKLPENANKLFKRLMGD